MHPLSPPRLPRRRRLPAERSLGSTLVLLALAAGLTAACAASKPTPEERAFQRQYPLQATSLQAVAVTPAGYVPVAPQSTGSVTQPWMEEQLRRLDDHYAVSMAESRAAFEQALGTFKNIVAPADLKPLAAGVGKLNADLTSLINRLGTQEADLAEVKQRLTALGRQVEQSGERQAVRPVQGASAAGDPDTIAFLEALKALQGVPRQTSPLRSWLAVHPNHPKAPEGFLQLGVAFLDNGAPTAARYYFKRLIEAHPASAEVSEAKAFLGQLPAPPKPAKKPAAKPVAATTLVPKATAAPPTTACDPKKVCPNTEMSGLPAPVKPPLAAPPVPLVPAAQAKPAKPGPKATAVGSAAPPVVPTAAQVSPHAAGLGVVQPSSAQFVPPPTLDVGGPTSLPAARRMEK